MSWTTGATRWRRREHRVDATLSSSRPPFRPRPDPSAKAVPAEEEEQGGAALVELEVPACFIPRHLKEEENVNVALDSTRGRGRRRVSPAGGRARAAVHSQTDPGAELLTAVNDVCVEPLARCVCILPSRWRVGPGPACCTRPHQQRQWFHGRPVDFVVLNEEACPKWGY